MPKKNEAFLTSFKSKKSLGQNFLICRNIILKIVNSLAICKNSGVLEIGPGFGSLTKVLAHSAQKVVAVEIDKRLVGYLEDFFKNYQSITIIHGNILNLDIEEFIKEHFYNFKTRHLVGNLPYYITTPILIHFLPFAKYFKTIVFMVQKEVAQRILAVPNTKDYSSLTLFVNFYTKVEKIADVSRNVFKPKPKVDSTILKFLPKNDYIFPHEEFLFKVIRAAFAYRRKTILNSLLDKLQIKKDALQEVFLKLKIDPTRRAETFTLDAFVLLAKELRKI